MEKCENIVDLYRSLDLDLTASLLCAGAQLVKMELSMHDSKVIFVLQHENIRSLVNSYLNDKMQIPIRQFKSRLFDLKAISLDYLNNRN